MEKDKILIEIDGKEVDLRDVIAESSIDQMKEMGFNFGEDGKVKLSALPPEVKSEVVKAKEGAEESANYIKQLCLPEQLWSKYGVKSTPINTGADSMGSLVPTTLANAILERKARIGVFAQRAFSFNLAGPFELPTEGEGVEGYWMGELDANDANLIPESEPTTGKNTLDDNYLAARVFISWKLLNSSAFDVQAFVARMMGRKLAEIEEAAFIAGDGVGKPLGIRTDVNVPTVAQLGEVTTRQDLMNLWFALPPQYRQSAIFFTSSGGVLGVNSIVDSTGRPIFDGAAPLDSVWGKPILESGDMPENLGAGSETEVWFGDPSYYYIKYGTGLEMASAPEIKRMKTELVVYQAVDGKLVLPEAFVKLTGVRVQAEQS